MRIENYLGFPVGITGGELAERATVQAEKFGARLPVASPVTGLSFENGLPVLSLDDGERVKAKCVLIATGADYRLLDVPGCADFEGRGVYYAATPVEAQMCRGSEVVVVGGGNSAGQAAVYLATQVRRVYLVVRGDDLRKDMSEYLARRVEDTPEIEVLLNTEVARISGDRPGENMGEVEVVNRKTGEQLVIETPALFSFIGAVPRSGWLPPEIERDAKQFIRTGPGLSQSGKWNGPRQPFLLETSHPGVFAAGDVRSGSVKRVASAVGEARWRSSSRTNTSTSCLGKEFIMANYTESDRLAGLRVAILITDGFEQVEMTEPRKKLNNNGADDEDRLAQDRDARPRVELHQLGRGLPRQRRPASCRPRQVRRASPARRRDEPRYAANRPSRGRIRPRVLRCRQARRCDLPRPVDHHRGRPRPRPPDDVLAFAPHRPAERRGGVGR